MKGILVTQEKGLRKFELVQMKSIYPAMESPVFLYKLQHNSIKEKVAKEYGNAKNAIYALQN